MTGEGRKGCIEVGNRHIVNPNLISFVISTCYYCHRTLLADIYAQVGFMQTKIALEELGYIGVGEQAGLGWLV